MVRIFIVDVVTHVLDAVKQAGHIKYSDIRQEGDFRSSVLHDERNIAVLAGLEKLAVTADDTVGINLDTHFSVGEAGDLFRKALGIDLGDSVLGTGCSQRPCIGLCAVG